MSGRKCPARYCPTILTGRERYCPTHAAEYEAKRGTPQQRGYDSAHRALRAHWQRRINSGELVYCARGCGARITGNTWDLGHTDNRKAYTGPECPPCNRSAGGALGRARQTQGGTPRGA